MAYRVIQWATGSVGSHALRSIIRHPELELVGLVVHSEEKVGRDAGELVGMEPVGVAATNDVEAILAMDADCVAYMPLPSAQVGEDPDLDLRVICDLLASGKSVVSAVGFVYPKALGPAVVDRIEAACRAGRATLHGTGVNPGFLSEVLPLTLSALCNRIDAVYVLDVSDFSTYPSPGLVVDMMGFAKPPGEYERGAARWRSFIDGLFAESLALVADGLAVNLTGTDFQHEVHLTDEPLKIAAGVVEQGTVAAQRWIWAGAVGSRPVITLEAVYRVHPDVAPHWPSRGGVRIEGRPRIHLELDEDWCTSGVRATAAHAVHAIPAVCRAEPGIRTFLDLPMIVGRHVVATATPDHLPSG